MTINSNIIISILITVHNHVAATHILNIMIYFIVMKIQQNAMDSIMFQNYKILKEFTEILLQHIFVLNHVIIILVIIIMINQVMNTFVQINHHVINYHHININIQ